MNLDVVSAMLLEDKEYFMKEALKEASKSFDKNETPIGAVIVYNNKIIARAHNLRETKQDSTCHAEILAIQKACKKLGVWRLEECDIYVTLEPCVMCAGAINLFDVNFNHKVNVEGGILEEECSKLVTEFFKKLRNK